jgi:hypothetical protein
VRLLLLAARVEYGNPKHESVSLDSVLNKSFHFN